ncbi:MULTISPECIES: hypothetical protein [unclassified Halomonas]|uniref:hypothetical protein n=1 Tax=unclassified Halomonas TaxID=2609666 RepID=UPI0018657BC0|nr:MULTISPECIES: hypothetical protein [unclassified Halomonas]
MVRKTPTNKVTVSRERIVRAVASSSAIETGERTAAVEKRLKSRSRRFAKLTLAF